MIRAKGTLYAGLALLLLCGGLYAALLLTRLQVSGLKADVSSLQATSKAQAAHIEALGLQREADNRATAKLEADVLRAVRAGAGVREQLNQLERNNAQVRDYLSLPVPPELACVLTRTCPAVTAP